MDPSILALLLSIVTNLATGPINVYDLPKNLINKFKGDPKPINHDLQKAIKIAYLQALIEIAQEFKAGRIQSFRLYLPTELDQKIKQWQTELKQVENAKNETEISSPLQDTAEIEQLLLSHGQPIGDRLQELETRLISQALQGIADIPADYHNQIQTGLFARIYAHFVEQLKINDRAYRAFELEYLPTINASLTEIGVGQEQVALTMTDMLSVVNRTDQNVQKIIDILNPKSLTLEDWQEICRQNLAQQKQLTTNPFTNAYGVTPELDKMYVRLAIVERKPPKPPSRNQQEEKEEEKLIPITEECFFEDVLRQGKSQISQGRKIAIIGEPGSGKTTRLQKIADWILEQDLGLPIWVSLADLTQPTVSQYIEEIWLKQTGKSLTIDELTQQKERIWLLLDGLDEMTSRVETRHVSALLGGWVQAARVVVTCRVNVWEADKNAFSGFDVFRNLEFNPEQVTDYIRRWFTGMGDAATGESLEAALAESENSRLKELIQNPLRLWMLCQIWQTGGGLPETQAELYGQFVDWVYRWKADEEILDQREAIDTALARLGLTGLVEKNPQTKNSKFIFQVPHLRSLHFKGRDQLLTAIKNRFHSDQTNCQIQILTGAGGFGKTQLALEYAYQNQQHYDLVWWIHSEEFVTLAKDYVNLAMELNLPEKEAQDQNIVIRSVSGFLQQTTNPWLLIFDNAEDVNQLRDYIPRIGLGHIIITSQKRNCWIGFGYVWQIPELSFESSVDLLIETTEQIDRVSASELAQELGNLPLALTQASAYILKAGCSIQEYLQLFKSYQKELLTRGMEESDYPYTVATTWQLAFDKIQSISPASIDLLKLCAFLAPDNIPLDLFRINYDELTDNIRNIFSTPLNFEDVIATLRDYSIIERKGDTISLHRLVQFIMRERMIHEDKTVTLKMVLKLIAKTLKFDYYQFQSWDIGRKYIEHGIGIINFSNHPDFFNYDLAILQGNIGQFLGYTGNIKEAQKYIFNSIEIYNKLIESEVLNSTQLRELSILIAYSYNFLGFATTQGNLQEEINYHSQAVKIINNITITDKNSNLTLNVAMCLGCAKIRNGETEQGVKLLKSLLDIPEKNQVNSELIGMIWTIIGVAMENENRVEKSLESYLEADKYYLLAQNETNVIQDRGVLSYRIGHVYEKTGQQEKADIYFDRAKVLLGNTYLNTHCLVSDFQEIRDKLGFSKSS